MNVLQQLRQTIHVTLCVIGSVWWLLAPSPTLAAEDHYKIPGWVCKPSNHLLTYPTPPQADPPHVSYDQLRARAFNNGTSTEQAVVCPLHIKQQIRHITKVLVDYTNKHHQARVLCTLNVLGANGKKEFKTAKSPSGPGQGFLSIVSQFSGFGEIASVRCTLPRKTALGTSSIDAIHVYQDKAEGESIGGIFGSFNQGGVAPATMPGVACHPLTDRPGQRYVYSATHGTLWNQQQPRPLEVVCPIVRDNTKTKKSPHIAIQMYNRNPGSRFQARCTTWVTGTSQEQSIRMLWKDPDGDGLGFFQTSKSVAINSNDTFSVNCRIPPAKGPALSDQSGIRKVQWQE